MSNRQEKLEQANRILGLICTRARFIFKSGRVAVEYPTPSRRKRAGAPERVSKVWIRGNSDHYPRWDYGEVGWGGTQTNAAAQLVRWINGQSVRPLRCWNYWCSETVRLADGNGSALRRYLHEIEWPEVVPCVICGVELTPDMSMDWWSYVHHGPCCWGAPSKCANRNERQWDYNDARWRAKDAA